ncbi:MAG TPA: GAF domain-containing sensor histidine kinase [Nitrospirae bacterium]|nr:GAF domain-containing sensor histidine kinase [Nitrospirota bacterium]
MSQRIKDRGISEEWVSSALSTVIKLSNIIGYLPGDIEMTLKTVAEEVYQLFCPEFCCVYMVDDKGSLEFTTHRGLDSPAPDLHIDHSMGSCIALRDGLPYVACENTSCPNRGMYGAPEFSHICIPMVTGSEAYGVISVTFPAGRRLERNEIDVLLAITCQTSAAIQRYRLFEKIRREKSEIEDAYREIKRLNEMLEGKIVELKKTQQRLIQSEKLAATGMLSAGLCHEINNPLSVILNRIECLRMEAEELTLPAQLMKDLDVIYTNASKVSGIVQDLLIFSRHQPVRFDYIDLRLLIEKVLYMLDDDLKRSGCRVHIEITGGYHTLYCDKERIEHVFTNILSNAIDAMPEGGNIHIYTRASEERKGYLEISIADEGVGIPEEYIHRIFDPFFTTKSLGKGTGLGLSICYGIVKAHKGEIRIKSIPDRGSTFTVVLPCREEVLKQ